MTRFLLAFTLGFLRKWAETLGLLLDPTFYPHGRTVTR